MTSLKDLLPTTELVCSTPVVDLAGILLRVLDAKLQRPDDAECLHNFALAVGNDYDAGGRGHREAVIACCAEAWEWLRSSGFIVWRVGHDQHWCTLSRLGREAVKQDGFAQWVAAQELPETMLRSELRGAALRLFRQGLFDTAVFEAFKMLEVAIRDAAGLGQDLVGVKLVDQVFSVEDGPLTDATAEKGERVALLKMMGGAIGSYKNPHSHRRIEITAAEAREMLLMASHLLGIVLSRRKAA